MTNLYPTGTKLILLSNDLSALTEEIGAIIEVTNANHFRKIVDPLIIVVKTERHSTAFVYAEEVRPLTKLDKMLL